MNRKFKIILLVLFSIGIYVFIVSSYEFSFSHSETGELIPGKIYINDEYVSFAEDGIYYPDLETFPNNGTLKYDYEYQGNKYSDSFELFPEDFTEFSSLDFLLEPLTEINLYVSEIPSGFEDKFYLVSDAILYWKYRDGRVINQVYSEEEADVRLDWIKEFGTDTIGHTLGRSHITISLGDSDCYGTWNPYSYSSIVDIITHELGHVLNYEHSSDSKDIMYANSSMVYEYEYNYSDVLPDLYAQYLPLCAQAEGSDYSIKVKSDNRIEVYLIPIYGEYEDYLDYELNTFDYDKTCSAKITTNFNKICSASYGAGIIIADVQDNKPSEYSIYVEEII